MGVEVNWGVRFSRQGEALAFLEGLSQELAARLRGLCQAGTKLTLKLRRRHQDAPLEPRKYLGCGPCLSLARSCQLALPSMDPALVFRAASKLYLGLQVPATEVRGLGLQMASLQPCEEGRPPRGGLSLEEAFQGRDTRAGRAAVQGDVQCTERAVQCTERVEVVIPSLPSASQVSTGPPVP